MKAIRLFSMAAVALMMGACSSENDIEQAQQLAPETGKIHFEATIAAPNAGDRTRTTITPGTGTDADKLFVAWEVNDEIALVHNGKLNKVKVTTVNPNGTAEVTGDITNFGAEGEAAKLVYPYAGVASADGGTDGTDYTPNTDGSFLAPGFSQAGTLAYISANHLDGRVGTGILKTVGGNVTIMSATEGNVKMENRTAIWKLTLTTDGTTSLLANRVTLSIGTTPIAATATDGTGKSEWTLCLVPATLALYTGNFTITALVGTDTYTYTKAGGITLVNGKYYQSTVTMYKKTASSAATTDIGKLICTEGHIHPVGVVAGCTAARVAIITYVGAAGTADASSTSYKGLALAWKNATVSGDMDWCSQKTNTCLSDDHQYSLSNVTNDMAGIANTEYLLTHTYTTTHTHTAANQARTYNSGVHPTGTSDWFLPSAGQWNRMFIANGGSGSSCTGLASLLSGVGAYGGDGLSESYWSSTECSGVKAWRWQDMGYATDPVSWIDQDKEDAYAFNVRACLAF